jgi:hypothetical protein
MIGFDPRWLAAHGLDANRIAGLVPLSPQAITHFTIRSQRGVSGEQPIIDELAPLYHVRKNAPPILLITGDREKELLGRYEENAYLWRMFQVVGHPDAELIELKGYDHGQMAEPAYPLLLRFVEQHRPVPADSTAESSYWNQFRRPNGPGVAPAAQVPLHFSPKTNALWKLAVPPAQYIASPIAVGDRLVVASAQGVVTVIAIADTLNVLARNELREGIYATPAVAGDRLYVRTVGHLYAFGP